MMVDGCAVEKSCQIFRVRKMQNAFETKLNAWITDSTSALTIKLISDPVVHAEKAFKPLFTYPVFGEEGYYILHLITEKIFGYKQLSITLSYAAGSLATYFSIHYASKLGDTQSTSTLALTAPPENVFEKLTSVLPGDYYDNYDAFMDRVRLDSTQFKPMQLGEKVHEYSMNESIFEIYKVIYILLAEFKSARLLIKNLKNIIESYKFFYFGSSKALLIFKRMMISGKYTRFLKNLLKMSILWWVMR
jgi:hypothetical protein